MMYIHKWIHAIRHVTYDTNWSFPDICYYVTSTAESMLLQALLSSQTLLPNSPPLCFPHSLPFFPTLENLWEGRTTQSLFLMELFLGSHQRLTVLCLDRDSLQHFGGGREAYANSCAGGGQKQVNIYIQIHAQVQLYLYCAFTIGYSRLHYTTHFSFPNKAA